MSGLPDRTRKGKDGPIPLHHRESLTSGYRFVEERGEEENMKVDGRREEGRRRGRKKGMVKRRVERRGGLERHHHPLCGGNQLANEGKARKDSPIPNRQDLIAPTSYDDRSRPAPTNEGAAHSSLT